MKAVCAKHHAAYEVRVGCLDCNALMEEMFLLIQRLGLTVDQAYAASLRGVVRAL